MLFFGHIGITSGLVRSYDTLVTKTNHDNDKYPAPASGHATRLRWRLGLPQNKIGRIDYRLVIIGSMLPDIIDKPMWFLAGQDVSLSGRDFAHSLLFNLVLFIGGAVLLRYRKSWLCVLSAASLTHLVFDQMWRSLPALLWPFGGPLRERETFNWLSDMLNALFTRPDVYVPEIIGLAVVLFFGYKLVVKKRIIQFLRSGAID